MVDKLERKKKKKNQTLLYTVMDRAEIQKIRLIFCILLFCFLGRVQRMVFQRRSQNLMLGGTNYIFRQDKLK